MLITDAAKGFFVRLYDDEGTPNLIIAFGIDNDTWRYYDNTGWHTFTALNVGVPQDDHWYHITLIAQFDNGTDEAFPMFGIIKNWRFRFIIWDGADNIDWSQVYQVATQISGFTAVEWRTEDADTGYSGYIDAQHAYCGTSTWWYGYGEGGPYQGYLATRDFLMYDLEDLTYMKCNVKKSEIVCQARKPLKAKLLIEGLGGTNPATMGPENMIRISDDYTSFYNAKIDQNGVIHKGLYNFRNDFLPCESEPYPVPVGWVDEDTSGGLTYVRLIDKYGDHARVMELWDYSNAYSASAKQTFESAQMSGTIELYITSVKNDYFGASDYWAIQVRDGSNNLCCFIYYSAGTLYYRNSAGDQSLGSYTTCDLHHVRIEFDCTTNTYSGWIDGVSKWTDQSFANNDDGSGLTFLRIRSNNSHNSYYIYVDAVDYSWSEGYYTNRNMDLDITIKQDGYFRPVIFEGFIEKRDRQKFSKLNLIDSANEIKNVKPGTPSVHYQPSGYDPILANRTEEVAAQILKEKVAQINVNVHENVFRGTLTFENEVWDYYYNKPFGINTVSAGGWSEKVKTDTLNNHKNYLEIEQLVASTPLDLKAGFPQTSFGTIEFYFRWDSDPGSDYAHKVMILRQNCSSNILQLGAGNSLFWARSGGSWVSTTETCSLNTWHHVKIDFECTTGGYLGLSQYKWQVTIDGGTTRGPYDFQNNLAYVSEWRIYNSYNDLGAKIFYDAIGYSWSSFYNVGDNKHIYIEKFETGSLTLDLDLDGEKSVKKLIDGLADMETFTWCLTPDHYLIFTEGMIDSQLDFTASNVAKTKCEEKMTKVNKVWLKGGYSSGYKYGVADNLASQYAEGIKLLVRFYTQVLTNPELNNIAASILAMEAGLLPKKLQLWFQMAGIGFTQPLQTYTIPSNTIYYSKNDAYIEAGQWLMTYAKILLPKNKLDFDLLDTLMFEYDMEDAEELAQLIHQT